jgi:IS4 transposase
MTVPPERQAGFPDEIIVRVITAKIHVRGFRDEEIVVVTSLLDDSKYPKEKILEWYLRRWEIEVSFRDMKTTLGYEFIRGRTPHIVKLELGVLVLAYNLLRYVIARGQALGKRRGIASTAAAAISFISTIPILYAARRSLV